MKCCYLCHLSIRLWKGLILQCSVLVNMGVPAAYTPLALFFSFFTTCTNSAYLVHQDLTRYKHFCSKCCTALPLEQKKQTQNWGAKADEPYQCTRLISAVSLCCSHKSHPCSLVNVFRNCGNQQTVLKACNLSHSAAGGNADSSVRETQKVRQHYQQGTQW